MHIPACSSVLVLAPGGVPVVAQSNRMPLAHAGAPGNVALGAFLWCG